LQGIATNQETKIIVITNWIFFKRNVLMTLFPLLSFLKFDNDAKLIYDKVDCVVHFRSTFVISV
jgi:hypothetical protein